MIQRRKKITLKELKYYFQANQESAHHIQNPFSTKSKAVTLVTLSGQEIADCMQKLPINGTHKKIHQHQTKSKWWQTYFPTSILT